MKEVSLLPYGLEDRAGGNYWNGLGDYPADPFLDYNELADNFAEEEVWIHCRPGVFPTDHGQLGEYGHQWEYPNARYFAWLGFPGETPDTATSKRASYRALIAYCLAQ